MRIYSLLIFCCIVISGISYSQIRLTIQPGLQVPIGDFANVAALGAGGNVTVEFLSTQKKGIDWSFTGMVGYNYFSASKDVPKEQDYSSTDIPIQAGLRYYLGKSDFKPYLGAELGFHLLTIKQKVLVGGVLRDLEASDSYFGFAPMLGFKSYFTRELEFDINLKLNSISSEGSSLSYLGFNFGVQFGLTK